MENIKRIHLLSSTEIEELYARPEFNVHEQNLYFSLQEYLPNYVKWHSISLNEIPTVN
ncbi:transposase [Xenorhabdus budapestensis]|uniref:Transposase n=1 Tax=Xenorhabdus budapestensis TaxID=290110 RepID=A0A2D0IT82_XENBU|nr:transposase [Xenorhabdus budapestensis]